MLIYIITFITSTLLLVLKNKIKNNYLKSIITFLALIIPCITSGLRASTVGTDVEVYVTKLFEKALLSNSFNNYLNSSWWSSWRYISVSDYEIGFSTLIYIIAKTFGNIQIVLFAIQSLIIFPLYFGIRKIDELNKNEHLAMIIFYFLFYNITYNAMRQFIGISVAFYGFCCMIKGNDKKFYIMLLIACLFHKSTIIMFIIFLLYKVLKNNKIIIIGKQRIQLKSLMFISIIIMFALVMSNTKLLATIFIDAGIDKYMGYLDGTLIINEAKIVKVIPLIIIIIFGYKEFKQKCNYSFFLILIFLFKIVISNLSSINIYGERLSYIFDIFTIITIPLIIICNNNRKYMKILLLLYLFVYWYYYYIVLGLNQTIPYDFFWIK